MRASCDWGACAASAFKWTAAPATPLSRRIAPHPIPRERPLPVFEIFPTPWLLEGHSFNEWRDTDLVKVSARGRILPPHVEALNWKYPSTGSERALGERSRQLQQLLPGRHWHKSGG